MFIVFDLETTGLDANSCEIIQFAYALFDNNNMFVRGESLYFYYEGMHWSNEVAEKTHKFTLDFLRQYKQDFHKNCIKMFTVLNGADVVGYNSDKFDIPFVNTWLNRNGLPQPQFTRHEDVMLFMRAYYKMQRIKLTKLTEMLCITEDVVKEIGAAWYEKQFEDCSAHNAMYDVVATSLITLYAIKFNYVDLSAKTMRAALESGDSIAQRVSIVNIPEEWLDQQHVHFCELASEEGSTYVGTCDSPNQFKPDSYKSLEVMPDIARVRLLPIKLYNNKGTWEVTRKGYTVRLNNVNNAYTLQYITPLYKLAASDINCQEFREAILCFAKYVA